MLDSIKGAIPFLAVGWTHLASVPVMSLVFPISAKRDEDKINQVFYPSHASFML